MKTNILKEEKGLKMKKLNLLILSCALLSSVAFAQNQAPAVAFHGGGNGGDDLELELKKRALQIGYFIKSEVGAKVFKVLNPDTVLETIEKTDFDIVTTNVVDKYGTIRTCVNEPKRSLVTCNLSRISELKKSGKLDIFTAILFHEILGIMELELGHQENVSMYPISSKIIPYETIISSTPISESDIRPEYFGLDQRSYGITLENKETKESIRMICLNSNVEIHRCRNYSIVRNSNGLQAPLMPSTVSISPSQLAQIKLNQVKASQVTMAEAKLKKIQNKGFKFISLRGTLKDGGKNYYRLGTGMAQSAYLNNTIDGDTDHLAAAASVIALAIIGITELDIVLEASKQVINTAVWPVKAAVNSFRLLSSKSELSKLNRNINYANKVLNLTNELNIVGKTQKIPNDDYNTVLEIIKLNLSK